MTDYDVSMYRRRPIGPPNRRFREGLFWLSEVPPPRNWKATLRDAMFVCAGLAFLFGVTMWMQARDLEVQLEEQKLVTKKYTRILADCMNGGGIYDKANNQGLFCGKAVAVKY